MGLHDILLSLHSLLRWGVLAAGVTVFVRAIARRGAPWNSADTKLTRSFVGLFDVQLLIGLLMYLGTSAFGVRVFSLGGAVMKNATLRFFAVEHFAGMLVAAAIVHIGTARARKLGDAPARHARTALVVGIGLLVIFASIPWPFFPYARPLLRMGLE